MKQEWLKRKLTITEATEENMVRDERLGDDPVPFGFQNASWKDLLAQHDEGDELWLFSSAEDSWQQMAGREGIALIREGEVIVTIITLMN